MVYLLTKLIKHILQLQIIELIVILLRQQLKQHQVQTKVVTTVVATENAMMDGMQTLLPTVTFPDTDITSSVRTTSATSPSGSETSFNLQGTTFAKNITLVKILSLINHK